MSLLIFSLGYTKISLTQGYVLAYSKTDFTAASFNLKDDTTITTLMSNFTQVVGIAVKNGIPADFAAIEGFTSRAFQNNFDLPENTTQYDVASWEEVSNLVKEAGKSENVLVLVMNGMTDNDKTDLPNPFVPGVWNVLFHIIIIMIFAIWAFVMFNRIDVQKKFADKKVD